MTDVAVTPPAPSTTGLTSAEVAERVSQGKVNDVPTRSSRSMGEIVRANVFTLFNAVIGTLFVIMLIIAPLADTLFGFIIFINTGIGIVQEWRAKKTLDNLAVVGQTKPRVRRDGKTVEIPSNELVLDDVIELGQGDKIVVDGDVGEAEGLEIDESLLTGEADPVHKKSGDHLMSGSFVVSGHGTFTALKVGREAYAAKLAEEASRFTLVDSELRNGVNKILKYVTWLLVPVSVALAASQMLASKNDFFEAVRQTISGIVPMIPEGLVLMTSIAFAVGVVRLGRKQCLVQELPAIEGLARVSVVCLDKTGTLTEGGMDVSETRILDSSVPVAEALGALGTTDPRPNASLQAVIDAYPAPEGWKTTNTMPFSSARKWSGASFEGHGSWLMGAPDVLLPAGHEALTEIEELNAQGLRVLLVASSDKAIDDPSIDDSIKPAAILILAQRLRPDAAETLRYFASQNVQTKIISGDNAVSVGAVATQLGIPGADHPVDARTLPEGKEELADALEKNTVFGRVTPRQKRDMVAALQSRGHTVAMTGDGVNDVLALKDADIGVSMGSGSEATRAVAQIVLLNNSFATLPSVVAEGRRVIGNIERVSNLFLTKTVYAVLLALLVAATQVVYPFLPRHMTLLNALTIGTPAFFLALAPNNERARTGFVSRVLHFAIPAGVICGAASFCAYLVAKADMGTDKQANTTIATLTLFLCSMWVLAMIARPYTWWRVALVATMGLAFMLVLVIDPLRKAFDLSLVSWSSSGAALGIVAVSIVLLELVWRRSEGRKAAEVEPEGA